MFANMTRSSIALAAALALGLALSACAHNNPDNLAAGAGYGASGPGSVQEFNQTVGDRVFFTTDQTDLSSTAQATLDKQAAWLNQYNKYSFTIEGHADERGTREYNFALGCAPRPGGARLSRRQGRLRFAHEDDQLWQGAAGRGLRRHFLLVAEPPRRHGAQRGGWQLRTCVRATARRGAPRLKIDRRRAYGPAQAKAIRIASSDVVISPLASSLCSSPASRSRRRLKRSSISSTAKPPPPADIPGGAPGDPDDAAGLVVRVNRLEEELRQANGRIEELENAQHRLEAQLQKFRQDVEFRLGDRSGGAPPDSGRRRSALGPRPAGRRSEAKTVGRIRSQRRSERARRAAAVGNDFAERPARARVPPRPWRASSLPPALRSNSAEDRRPLPQPSGPIGRRLRGGDARSAA